MNKEPTFADTALPTDAAAPAENTAFAATKAAVPTLEAEIEVSAANLTPFRPVANYETTEATAAAPGASAEKAVAEPPTTNDPAPAATSSAPPQHIKLTTSTSPLGQLWQAVRSASHSEIWGVTLLNPEDGHVPSQIVLQKYLNANDGDVAKAKEQLLATLAWRTELKPLELVKKTYSKAKFDGLGFVTRYDKDGGQEPEDREVFTWNVYGATKSIDETFGQLDEFIEWRVALMELALHALDLPKATKPITTTYDPYKIFQVHDYKSISFLRQSSQVKSASSTTIKIFTQYYPELLKEKFFVNVPAVMGAMYTFVKLFVAPKTAKKFHPLAKGASLAREFVTADGASTKLADLGKWLPSEYGGKGMALTEQGEGLLLE